MTNTPATESRDGDTPFSEMVAWSLYSRRKLLLWIWVAVFAACTVAAFMAPKRYTSATTVQISPEASQGSLGALSEGLKMLDPRSGKSDGLGTALAVMESRQLAIAMIERFDLKRAYRTRWEHLAVKKFHKNLAFRTFDEGIVQLSFTHRDQDTCKIILDAITEYVNDRVIEYSSSKARQEFAFNRSLVDSVYARIDSVQAEAVSYLRRHNIVDVKSNLEVMLQSYAQIQDAILQLESRYAVAMSDNRVSLQERQNLKTQIEAMKRNRRELFLGRSGGEGDVQLSIAYDSMPSVAVWEQKMELLVERDKQILKVLLPKLEESRIKMVETTPVINVIDPSFVPPYKSGPKRALIMAVGTILVAGFLTFALMIRDLLRNPRFDFAGLRTFRKNVQRLR